MKGPLTRTGFLVLILALMAGAGLLHPALLRAADNDLPIYFEDSVLVLKTQTINRVVYLPLAELVRQLGLPFTNNTAQEIYTLGSTGSQIVLTRNSAAISVKGQITLLPSPVLHDNGAWLVPYEFLAQGLTKTTGTEFRRKAGAPRVFAGAVKPADLALNAQSQGALTRLTLRTSTPVNIELRREAAQHRAILVMTPRPLDPARESFDFKDRLIQSINFSDSDGSPKLIVETSDEVTDIRMATADENRVHFIDFVRKSEVTEAAPAPATPAAPVPSTAAPARPAPRVAGSIRVIVIDPGHGGTDIGASSTGALEKDLNLAIARKLRATLQARLGATVLLTRDSDVALTTDARAAVANNNQADLFISLHVGYSANISDFSSAVYVIQDNFAAKLSPTESGQRLFQPWYLSYRTNRPWSVKAATTLSEELNAAIPGWKFPVRSGPIGVLASTTMPSILIEVGNLNNPVSAQALLDNTFQNKLGATVATAIERFAAARQAEK